MVTDPTRATAFAMPVYNAPAPGASSTNITTATTTEVKSTAGFVSLLSINTGVAGKTIKLYDGDPGSGGVLLGTWSAASMMAVALGIPFNDSLYAVTDGAADVTLVVA